MDFSHSDSGSEDELDVQELEVALYSQIHHDNGETKTSFSNKPVFHFNQITLPLRVGIRELPTRITPFVRKQPILGGDFLAFSNNEIGDNDNTPTKMKQCELCENVNIKLKSTEDEQCIYKKIDNKSRQKDEKIKADMVQPELIRSCSTKRNGEGEGVTFKSDSQEVSCSNVSSVEDKPNKDNISDEKGNCNFVTLENKKKYESESKFSDKISGKKGEEKQLQEKELLLPFSITNVKKRSLVQGSKALSRNTTISTEVSISLPSKSKKSDCTKLEEFLELSGPKKASSVLKLKKKKPLNKFDAAVKPREPTVRLRKGPYVAVSRYKQDSDTNTDYSDSDTSSNASPVKVKTTATSSSVSVTVTSQDNLCIFEEEKKAVVDASSRQAETDKSNEDSEEDSGSNQTNPHLAEPSVSIDDNTSGAPDSSTDDSDESENESSSEDSDQTSDSENTQSSDPDDSLSLVNPDLDFNLDGGVERLLTASNPAASRWKIDEKDRYNINSLLSRYFSPKRLQCRNCKGEGHLSRDCPQPMKRPCIFCGIEGHEYKACPNAICFNCDAPGHRNSECTERKRRWNSNCDRCWMPGHEEKVCPDRWRQYHITVKPHCLITTAKTAKNPLRFCYNCGKQGHLGFECTTPRMNPYVAASYPFIAQYDTKRKRQGEPGQRWSTHHKDHKKGKHHHEISDGDAHDRGRGGRQHSGRSHGDRPVSKDGVKHHQIFEDSGHSRKRAKNERVSKTGKKMKTYHLEMEDKEKKPKGRPKGKATTAGSKGGKNFPFELGRRPRSKPRKEEPYEEGEIVEDHFYDDLESHQVSNNEWWKKKDKSSKKRRKNYERQSPRSSDADWRLTERHVARDTWMPDTRDEEFPRRGGKRTGVDDHWNRNDCHRSSKRFRPSAAGFSKSQHSPSSESLNAKFHNRQISGDDRNLPQSRLRHSSSWPMLQNPGGNRGGNRSGFRVQNERFISMKQNCDITVSLRK